MAKRAPEIIIMLVVLLTLATAVYSLSTDKMVSLSNHKHIITLE